MIGGLIDITKNEDGTQRWLLCIVLKIKFTQRFFHTLEDNTSYINSPTEWTESRIKTDEEDIVVF